MKNKFYYDSPQGLSLVVSKHLQGQHDQATHGNWAGHHGQAVDRKNTAQGNPYPHPIQTAYDNVVAGKEGIVSPIDAPAWLDAMADRTDNPDLTNLEILGTQYFTKDNLGIMRDHMPQIPPDTQEAFIKAMQARGVRVDLVDVTPFGLHPIQAEISATKSGKIFRKMKKEGVDDTPIVVSSDDFVIDGHHRWAAGLFLGLSPKHRNIKLKALRVDMPQEQLLDVVLAWNKAVGISSIALGADVKDSMKKMLAFDIAVLKGKIKSTEVEKHLQGQHDQSTHGRRFNTEVAPEVVHDVLAQVAENGGLSIKLTDGSLPPDGYMVSRNSEKFGTVVMASDFFNEKKGAKILGAFLIKNKAELGSGRAYLGVWHETSKTVNGVTVEIPKDQQRVHLDVTDKIVSKKQAVSLGRRRNQISIWDVVNFDEIQTGGTGGTVEKGNYKHSLIPETVESDDGRGNYGLGGKDLREVTEASVIVQVPVSSFFTKHLQGQHDQSSHGSWAGGSKIPMVDEFADAWIGGTDKYPFAYLDEIRGAYRVLTDVADNFYPKMDENGRVQPNYKEVFDSTKQILLALADAKPLSETMYRGLSLSQFDSGHVEKLTTVGSTFKEDLASWTPDEGLAKTFSQERYGRKAETSILIKIDGLRGIPLTPHTSNKSEEVLSGKEVIASGSYTVSKVIKTSNNSYEVTVIQNQLPYDPLVVASKNFNTEEEGVFIR